MGRNVFKQKIKKTLVIHVKSAEEVTDRYTLYRSASKNNGVNVIF